jgi:predicted ATP-grasp superfamily ATP-dependent carboligase
MNVFVYEHVTAAFPDAAVSLMAEGRAMLDAINADFRAIPGVELLTLDSRIPFDDLAAQADYTLLIAPEFDGILERLAQKVLDVGGKLLGPSPEAIKLTADKLVLHHHWLAHGTPTPDCHLWKGESSPRLQVIKPRDGAGSQSTRRSDLEANEKWPGELIAQDYVEGIAASVALLVGPEQIITLLPTEQILSTDGRFHYLGSRIPIAKPYAERAVTIAKKSVANISGLRGYVGVDLILGEKDWAIEINPRLTTSYIGLRRLARFNIASVILNLISRNDAPDISWIEDECIFSLSEKGFQIDVG